MTTDATQSLPRSFEGLVPHSLPTATAGVNVRTLCAVRASAASPRPHSPLRRHTPYTYTPVRRTSTPLPTYPTDARCRLRCPSPGCSPPTTHNASSLCDRCTCAPHWRCSDRTNTPGCRRRQRPADDPVTRHRPRTRPSSIITEPAPTHVTGALRAPAHSNHCIQRARGHRARCSFAEWSAWRPERSLCHFPHPPTGLRQHSP